MARSRSTRAGTPGDDEQAAGQSASTLRGAAPFALAVLLAFAVVPVEHPREHVAALAVAAGLAVGVVVAVAAIPWSVVPRRLQVLPVFAVFPIIGLLRHAEGGAASELGPLLIMPLLWLALYGSRRQLIGGVVLGGATLAVPALLVGAPEYPSGEWARLGVYAIVAPIATWIVQSLVRRVQSQADTLKTLKGRLALTEESFRAAFVDAPVAQFMCAPNGALLRVNDAMCALVGVESDELFGGEIGDLFEPADAARVDAVLLALWEGEETGPVELEVGVRRDGGDELVAMLRVDVVRGGADRPLFLLGHALDVTARVTEARDRDVRADVGRAVRAATRQLGDSPDARRLLCETAVAMSGAAAAVLMEDDGGGSLAASAQSGAGRSAPAVQIGRKQSHAATALASHRPILAAADEAGVDLVIAGADDVRSALFAPILRDGVAVGVLIVGWSHAPAEVPDEALVAVHMLAAETGVVLARADHLGTLERLAHQDALTGLPNRRVWEERLPGEMARSLREGTPLCAAIIDLDHFKRFNDTHGHQAGDRLLLDAARVWRARLRRSDVLARYGGEEFAVILPRCDRDRAVALLERLRAATPKPATCSIGVAAWDGKESLEDLVRRADDALYAAKRAGRDCTVAAGGDADAPVPGEGSSVLHAVGDA